MLEQVAQPGAPASQMVRHVGAHQRPAQPRAVGDRGVDVLDAGDALEDQVDRLAIEGHLHAVGDVARHLAAEPDRPLAERGVEARGPVDHRRVGLFAADHLDQRDQMGRVERVADDVALRAHAPRLQLARHQARGARGEHRVLRERALDLGKERSLGGEILRAVLLDEAGVLDRCCGIFMDREAGRIGVRREAEPLERRPCPLDEGAHPRLGVRRRVVDPDGEAAGEEQRGPARADRAGAQYRDALDVFRIGTWHRGSLS